MKRDTRAVTRRLSRTVRRIQDDTLVILFVLLTGLIGTVAASWSYQVIWNARNTENFQQVARERVEVIRGALRINETVLRSVAGFFLSSRDVDRHEFEIYTSQVLQDHGYIQAVEWLPRTTESEVAARERDCAPGFKLRHRDRNGGLVVGAPRQEQYPICYAEPLAHNQAIIGFDFTSDSTRGAAARTAIADGRIAASAKIYLFQKMESAREQTGVAFTLPVFRSEEDRAQRRPDGLIVSIVPLAHMIEAAIKPLNYSGVNIIIRDLSVEDSRDRLLYVRSTRLKNFTDEEILLDRAHNDNLRLIETLDVGGRKWEVTVLSARGYFQERMQLTTWVILMAGIVFTLLVVIYMYARARQSRTIVSEVDRRTYELAAAKKKTEMILLSTKEGIIGLDAEGYVTFCNPMAETLLGYAPGELIGKSAGLFSRADTEGEMAALSPSLRRILESGEIYTISDEIFWRKSGDTIEVEYNGSPLIEEDAIVGAVLLFRDISERKEMARQLEKMARYDQLTGLSNRALFMESLRAALARARRTGRKVGVIFMDLNGFKPVNDTLGHAAGDTLLKMFAERLSRVVRDTDLAARIGGDEFTLLVDGLNDVDEALILVERIRQALSKPFEIARHPFWITASMGIAVYPDHAVTLDDLVKRADHAMYKAKKEKSVDCVIYSKDIEK